MKDFNYSLSNDDYSAIICIFDVITDLLDGMDEDVTTSMLNTSVPIYKKLVNRQTLTTQDSRFIATLVDLAYGVLQNELPASSDTLNALRKYMFTIHKLHSVFS